MNHRIASPPISGQRAGLRSAAYPSVCTGIVLLLTAGTAASGIAASGAEAESARTPDTLVTVNQPLSLEQAVGMALQYSPTVTEAQQDTAAAQARVRRADAAGLPSASATFFASRSGWNNILSTPDSVSPTNLMGVPPGNFLDQNIMAMAPLYTGGRAHAASRAAHAGEEASESDAAAVRQDLALQTRIAYRRALYQRELVDAERQSLDAVQEELRVDDVRYQAGKIAEVILYRDRAAVAASQQQVANAVRDWKTSLAALATVMGVSVQSTLSLSDTLDADPLPPITESGNLLAAPMPEPPPAQVPGESAAPTDSVKLSRLLAEAESQRPEMAAARQHVAEAAAQVQNARASFRPQVNLVGMADLTHGDGGVRNGLNYTFGVAAGIPLFDGGARDAAQQEAEAGIRKARAALTAMRLQVDDEVTTAVLNRSAAEENVATGQAALAQTEEDYSIQKLRFTTGKGIQVEVLDALAAETQARVALGKARFEAAVAGDQLRRALGVLLPPAR